MAGLRQKGKRPGASFGNGRIRIPGLRPRIPPFGLDSVARGHRIPLRFASLAACRGGHSHLDAPSRYACTSSRSFAAASRIFWATWAGTSS